MKLVSKYRNWIYALILFVVIYWSLNGALGIYEGSINAFAGMIDLFLYGPIVLISLGFLILNILKIVRGNNGSTRD